MTQQINRERVKFFLLGAFVVLVATLLIAADNTPPAPNYGRYQISSWAGQIGPHAGGVGAFIVDTATGETKTVYSRIYGDAGSSELEKNNLRKPFFSMR